MPKDNSRGRSNRNDDWGVTDLVRDRPIAAAAAAAGAAAAGLFLWSKRNQISQQLSDLSDQISEWTENMGSGGGKQSGMDDTAGLTTTGSTGTGKMGRPRSDTGRSGSSRSRGMSETGGGNASLGAHSGGGGATTNLASRGRGRGIPSTT